MSASAPVPVSPSHDSESNAPETSPVSDPRPLSAHPVDPLMEDIPSGEPQPESALPPAGELASSPITQSNRPLRLPLVVRLRRVALHLGWQGGLFVLFLLLSGVSGIALIRGWRDGFASARTTSPLRGEIELVAESPPSGSPSATPSPSASTPVATAPAPLPPTPPSTSPPPLAPPPALPVTDSSIALAGATLPAVSTASPATTPAPTPQPAATTRGAVLSGGISDDDSLDIIIRANPASP